MQIPAEDIIAIIVIITLIFVIVAGFILTYVRLYNQRKRKEIEEKKRMKDEFENQLLRSQVEVQETTMAALGRELHDNVGQLLSTTKMLLGITERNTATLPDTFGTAQATLTKAILELRSLSKTLDKEWLEQFDFLQNIQSEIARINASQTLRILLEHSGELRLNAEKQIILFRIVQEAVQNSIKHADAKTITITIHEAGQNLLLTISDDGRGMQSKIASQGMGLFNMEQRVKLMGGAITWDSIVGKGTSVHISIPLNK